MARMLALHEAVAVEGFLNSIVFAVVFAFDEQQPAAGAHDQSLFTSSHGAAERDGVGHDGISLCLFVSDDEKGRDKVGRGQDGPWLM